MIVVNFLLHLRHFSGGILNKKIMLLFLRMCHLIVEIGRTTEFVFDLSNFVGSTFTDSFNFRHFYCLYCNCIMYCWPKSLSAQKCILMTKIYESFDENNNNNNDFETMV